jgi:ATP-binding cassette, subfamily B, bacterial
MYSFPHFKQYDEMDCGPTCLRIICKYYGKNYSLDFLRTLTYTNRSGTSMLALSKAAEKLGLRPSAVKISFADLADVSPFPCIAFWNQAHFVVVYKIKKDTVYVSDPAHGLLTFTKQEFLKGWAAQDESGIVLSLELTADFATEKDVKTVHAEKGLASMFAYLTRYKKQMIKIVVCLIIASALQLIFPVLTQRMVDVGIANADIGFIYMILLAQLMVFLGKTTVDFFRSYILLHVSTRINIHMLTDFFVKLMRLPLGYFDTKMVGDTLQRINDHKRIENFLTSGALNTIFSLLNLVIFGIVLGIYNLSIFFVFLLGSVLYIFWILAFMKKRAALDYKMFHQIAANQEKNYELIIGMQEIKLHNAEQKKRWQWEMLQIKLLHLNVKTLSLRQLQTGGATILNELKNIVILFLAAKLVVEKEISLGVMLSISYIIGQLNSPILQLIEFMQSYQDTKLSLARINEIQQMKDEVQADSNNIQAIPTADIVLENCCFKYDANPFAKNVLENISTTIPANKITAIVGSSGSGKTTLLKLLLKFYEPTSGSIKIGDNNFNDLPNNTWRDKCGVVMQEGFIFNDTIENNIAVGDESIEIVSVSQTMQQEDETSDMVRVSRNMSQESQGIQRLIDAAKTANIFEFINNLPLGFKTKIGGNGMGISTGQKQRILIARAIYKNPDIFFFDEATSALDANNEKIITENLNSIFANKTVVIIAHRLSTVKNADNIIVLHDGKIIEEGKHNVLIKAKGYYYDLVSNQLELGV